MTRYASAPIIFKQPIAPDNTSEYGPTLGDLWVDTSQSPPVTKKLTSMYPFVWVSIEGAGGGTSTIASGTSVMGTSAISSGVCAPVVTTGASGVATTDAIIVSPNTDPTAVTGYGPSASGSLYIQAYPTANNVNFKVCNNTGNSITPSALTLNWRVVR